MSARSKTSRRPTSPGPDSATSSPALEAGPMLFGSPACPTMPTSGPGPVRVSRSRTRARGAEFATLDIFGQHGSHSSASADLQRSLESKLRDLMGSRGSMVFSLTWKDLVTPAGRRLLAREARPLHTAGTAFTLWPTPTRATSGNEYTYSRGDHDAKCLTLHGAARLAAWPTATVTDWKGATTPGQRRGTLADPACHPSPWATPKKSDAERGGSLDHIDGRRSNLMDQVLLAPWATPTFSQAGGTPEQFLERKARTRVCGVALTDLGMQVSTWIPGATADGSIATTASVGRSRLNPRFSLWLMGYPIAWVFCGERVTRSSRSKRRSSSQPRRPRVKKASRKP
jgi:hypothetical protein